MIEALAFSALFGATGIPVGYLHGVEYMKAIESDIRYFECSGCPSDLEAVNAGVNKLIEYVPDFGDDWAGPTETIASGTGDCEDYAILKMAILKTVGVPLSDMAITVVYDRRRELYHAVLVVQTVEGNMVLDNVRDEVLPDTSFPDYMPVYTLNENGNYFYGRPE